MSLTDSTINRRRRSDHHSFKTWIIIIAVGIAVAFVFASTSMVFVLNSNANEVRRLRDLLVSEKICSATNQDGACRALFDRLALNLSDEQRFRLACDVLAALETHETITIRAEAKCPPPIKSP